MFKIDGKLDAMSFKVERFDSVYKNVNASTVKETLEDAKKEAKQMLMYGSGQDRCAIVACSEKGGSGKSQIVTTICHYDKH